MSIYSKRGIRPQGKYTRKHIPSSQRETRASEKDRRKGIKAITRTTDSKVEGAVTRFFANQTGKDGFIPESMQTTTGTESGAVKLVAIVDQDGTTWRWNVWSMT